MLDLYKAQANNHIWKAFKSAPIISVPVIFFQCWCVPPTLEHCACERINIFSGIVCLNKTYGNFFAAERGGVPSRSSRSSCLTEAWVRACVSACVWECVRARVRAFVSACLCLSVKTMSSSWSPNEAQKNLAVNGIMSFRFPCRPPGFSGENAETVFGPIKNENRLVEMKWGRQLHGRSFLFHSFQFLGKRWIQSHLSWSTKVFCIWIVLALKTKFLKVP